MFVGLFAEMKLSHTLRYMHDLTAISVPVAVPYTRIPGKVLAIDAWMESVEGREGSEGGTSACRWTWVHIGDEFRYLAALVIGDWFLGSQGKIAAEFNPIPAYLCITICFKICLFE